MNAKESLQETLRRLRHKSFIWSPTRGSDACTTRLVQVQNRADRDCDCSPGIIKFVEGAIVVRAILRRRICIRRSSTWEEDLDIGQSRAMGVERQPEAVWQAKDVVMLCADW